MMLNPSAFVNLTYENVKRSQREEKKEGMISGQLFHSKVSAIFVNLEIDYSINLTRYFCSLIITLKFTLTFC